MVKPVDMPLESSAISAPAIIEDPLSRKYTLMMLSIGPALNASMLIFNPSTNHRPREQET